MNQKTITIINEEFEALEAALMPVFATHINSVEDKIDMLAILAFLSGRSLQHAVNEIGGGVDDLGVLIREMQQRGYDSVECLCEKCIAHAKESEQKGTAAAHKFMKRFIPDSH